MKIDVYDTIAHSDDGRRIHFDVLVPSNQSAQKAKQYAQRWIEQTDIAANTITLRTCQFCHSSVANPEVQNHIAKQGHYILPLQD